MRPTTHAAAILGNREFSLEAVSDVDLEHARIFAERWGGARVMDEAAFMDANCDLVAVCTPDRTHATLLCRLLSSPRAPRLIVMEKPLCVGADELLVLENALAAHSNSTIVTNHSRRFESGHLTARDLIASGRLGPVVSVHWVYYGGWIHTGPHLVDVLRLLLGGELEPIKAESTCEDRAGDPCLDVSFRCSAWPQARIRIEAHPETAFQLFEGEIRLHDARLRFLDFGSEILLEEVRTNAAGERELGNAAALVSRERSTAMQGLYELAGRYLTAGDEEIVERAGFSQTAATMQTVFAAKAQAAKAS